MIPLGQLYSQTQVTDDGIRYTALQGSVRIEGYVGSSPNLVVPSQIAGQPVASFATNALNGNRIVARIALPATIQSVSGSAFVNAPNLVSIDVDPANPSFASVDGVLFDKMRRQLISFPGGRVGEYFVPEGVERIVHPAMANLGGLRKVRLPRSLSSFDAATFQSGSLIEIDIDSGNPMYTAIGGVLFSRNLKSLLAFPTGRPGPYSVPAGVVEIFPGAFYGARGLTELMLPVGVTTIGSQGIRGCTVLEQISLPSTLTVIGGVALAENRQLRRLILPDSVASIAPDAFRSCLTLEVVYLPASVRSVPDSMFSGCPSLKSVFFGGAPPTLGRPFDSAPQVILYHKAEQTWPPRIGSYVTQQYTDTGNALSNLSVRTYLIPGQRLTVGSVTAYGSRAMLFRAAGPALGAFGLEGLPDPRLEVRDRAGIRLAANDNWTSQLGVISAAVGAFPFPMDSRDAALSAPVNGQFTVSAEGEGEGNCLIEVYDTEAGTFPRLINLSVRTRIGAGDDVLIAGFVLKGSGERRLLVRAVGPGLSQFGLSEYLGDPRLAIYDTGGSLLTTNDDWAGSATTAFSEAGAFPLPAGSKDAAAVVTLRANSAYTVQVRGGGTIAGEALVEIYELK